MEKNLGINHSKTILQEWIEKPNLSWIWFHSPSRHSLYKNMGNMWQVYSDSQERQLRRSQLFTQVGAISSIPTDYQYATITDMRRGEVIFTGSSKSAHNIHHTIESQSVREIIDIP